MFKSVITALIIFFTTFSVVEASSISLSSSQSQITETDEYIVNFSLSVNADDGTTYYLRGEFFRPGTSSYCGFTWNGNSWFNGPYTTNSGWQNLLPISIQANSATGQLKGKIDVEDGGCNSSGTYNFRIQRYTQSGNSSSDDQISLEVLVAVSTPVPTSVPTENPTSMPSSTPSSTKTPSPTPKPTPKPTKKPTATPEVLGKDEEEDDSGIEILRDELASPTPSSEPSEKKKFPLVAGLFIVGGVGFIGVALFPFLRQRLARYNIKNNEKND